MAYLDEIACAAAVLMRSDKHSENAAFTYIVTQRFRDWGKSWVPCSDKCTAAKNDENGFSLSFGEKHLHYRRYRKRWFVSENKNAKPDSFDAHDIAVEEFSAPFAFLEGMAFFSDCLESASFSEIQLQLKTEKKVEKRIDKMFKLLSKLERSVDNAKRRLNADKLVHMRKESSIVADIEEEMPPSPPSNCIHPDAAKIAFKGMSGCYFLWKNSCIEYVGRANCIGSRLSGHHKLRDDHFVSCVSMPKKESWFAEAYYIWKYRPRLNGEFARAERAGD